VTLPIVWAGQSVNDDNLQDTVAGPWARVVDGNLSSNSGRNYTNLQDAWDAASPGDSIFVKADSYAAGLAVSSVGGNNKDGIRIVGESGGNLGADGVPTFGAAVSISDCDNLVLENLGVESTASGNGWFLENLNRYLFRNLHARSCFVDGFGGVQLRRGRWVGCTSRDNTGRGFVLYDQMQHNTWAACEAENNGSHGWSIGAFPASNQWCVYNELLACNSYNNGGTGDGFSISLGSPATGAKGWQHLALVACNANDNAGDGFDIADISAAGVNSNGIRVQACNAYANGSFGYRLSGFPASNVELSFVGNQHGGNVGGGYSGMPATLLPGYVGRGLTAPGTNR
jgi:hypothetical protein